MPQQGGTPWGWQAIRNSPSDQAALEEISDESKRLRAERQVAVEQNAGQNLQRTMSPDPENARTLDEIATEKILDQFRTDDEKREAKIFELSAYGKKMQERLQTAKKTKHLKAQQTYQQVLDLVQKQIEALQDLSMEGPTSQPAGDR